MLIENVSRRSFLTAASGLAIGFFLPLGRDEEAFAEALFTSTVAVQAKAARRQRWAVTPSPSCSSMRRQPR
jgi:hypothetical protein